MLAILILRTLLFTTLFFVYKMAINNWRDVRIEEDLDVEKDSCCKDQQKSSQSCCGGCKGDETNK